MTRSSDEGGFTLVETLLGLALSSLLLVFILSGIVVARRALEHGRAMERTDAMQSGEAALLRQIGKALNLTWVDDRIVQHLAFDGERQRLGFVALSDASTQTGGLLATSLGLGGKPGDGSVTLASEVFAPRRSFAAFLKAPGDTSVLTHVRDLEFRYFGAKDANSPLQWHTDWHEAGQMPQLVSVAVEFSSQPGIWAGPWLVRLRQKL